jgi:hypothetical protein
VSPRLRRTVFDLPARHRSQGIDYLFPQLRPRNTALDEGDLSFTDIEL